MSMQFSRIYVNKIIDKKRKCNIKKVKTDHYLSFQMTFAKLHIYIQHIIDLWKSLKYRNRKPFSFSMPIY